MKGRQIRYSTEELAWIEERKAMPRRACHAAFCKQFGRNDVNLENFKSLCWRKGWSTGRDGCFEPGAMPVNKGVKCEPGKGGLHPNARATHFAKGVRQGVAVRLYKPIGTERLSKEGYLERKIHDDLPLQSRWRAVHRINWEAINGPVPAGHVLKCLDGNKQNTDPSNWELISRSLLPRLAGRWAMPYDSAEPEIKPTLLAIAKLKVAAKDVRAKA